MRVASWFQGTPSRSHVGRPSSIGATTIASPHVGFACRNGTLTRRTSRLPFAPRSAGPRSCAHGVSLSSPRFIKQILIVFGLVPTAPAYETAIARANKLCERCECARQLIRQRALGER